MSFGWGVGDLIAGANLTYTLIKHLSDTQGACIEYQEAIHELGALQHAFMRIEFIRANTQMDPAILNGATHLVMSSMGLIEKFLEKTKKYRQRLHAGSPGLMISNTWLKVGWTSFRKEELVDLKSALNAKLTSLTLLLTTAQIYEGSLENNPRRKYRVDSSNLRYELSNDPRAHDSDPSTHQFGQTRTATHSLNRTKLEESPENAAGHVINHPGAETLPQTAPIMRLAELEANPPRSRESIHRPPSPPPSSSEPARPQPPQMWF